MGGPIGHAWEKLPYRDASPLLESFRRVKPHSPVSQTISRKGVLRKPKGDKPLHSYPVPIQNVLEINHNEELLHLYTGFGKKKFFRVFIFKKGLTKRIQGYKDLLKTSENLNFLGFLAFPYSIRETNLPGLCGVVNLRHPGQTERVIATTIRPATMDLDVWQLAGTYCRYCSTRT